MTAGYWQRWLPGAILGDQGRLPVGRAVQATLEGASESGRNCVSGSRNSWSKGWVVTVWSVWKTHSRWFHFAGGGQV